MVGTVPGMTEKTDPATTKWAIGIGAVLVAICGWAALKGPAHHPEDSGADAEHACQELVKDRLKSPASAKFSGLSHTGTGDEYTVTGSVDSQNSFGALMRSDFVCTVRANGDSWHLVSLTGLN